MIQVLIAEGVCSFESLNICLHSHHPIHLQGLHTHFWEPQTIITDIIADVLPSAATYTKMSMSRSVA